jgi:uncharacterized protein YigE (DUF2233 family)
VPAQVELEPMLLTIVDDHAMLLSPTTAAASKSSARGGRGAAAACLALLLLAAGCKERERERGPDAAAFDPAALAQGGAACTTRDFEGAAFTICQFDSRRDEIRLAWRGRDGQRLGSLAALEASLAGEAGAVRFAMNAGMYDEDGAPVGLFVADGERVNRLNLRSGPGNFHLLPNGVFAVGADGSVSVAASPAFARRGGAPRWATQSGPMLVIGGRLHPKFDADGPSRLVRNGVGVRDSRTAFFVISEQGVSFGRFARFFRDALGCPDALYLDGSVSSLWDPGAGRQDGFAALGPMLVVLRKESAPRP